MGAGLKIDRPFGLGDAGALTWRLLGIAMPLTIAGACRARARPCSGSALATALLLAASLAPTDPVLASDVQVGPPGEGEEDEVRFTLTSEAGLNDGLAFPFVHLAIALALAAQTGEPWLVEWLTVDVVLEDRRPGIGVGLAGRPGPRLADLPPAEPRQAVPHRRRLRGARHHLPRLRR